MTIHLDVPFETLVELVEQLPVGQQQLLLSRIQERIHHKDQAVDEKMRQLRAAQTDTNVLIEPSPRREDWYDDAS